MTESKMNDSVQFGTPQKIMLTVIGLILGGYLLFGSSMLDAMSILVDNTRETVNDTLSDSFRIDQAEKKLEDAKSSITSQQERVSELRVSCDNLNEMIEDTALQLHKMQDKFIEVDESWVRSNEGTHGVLVAGVMLSGFDLRRALELAASEVNMLTDKHDGFESLLVSQQKTLFQKEKHLAKMQRRYDRAEMSIESSRFDLEYAMLLQATLIGDVSEHELEQVEAVIDEVAKNIRVKLEVGEMMEASERIVTAIYEDSEGLVENIRNKSSRGWE